MNSTSLLQRYIESNDESAFAEFVRQHLDLVYFAGLRRLGGDAARAEEVAQYVFTAAAQQARVLARHPCVEGWLYTTTRNAALKLRRDEALRARREEEASLMQQLASDPAADWSRLQPLIDEALDDLDAVDREAVLLRFFAQRRFGEIGAALRVSEDAARMRVERALERLRRQLARRGLTSTAATLALALAQPALQAAPLALANSIAAAALSPSATAAAGSAITLFGPAKALAVLGAAAAVALGTGTYVVKAGRAAPPFGDSPRTNVPPTAAIARSVDAASQPPLATSPGSAQAGPETPLERAYALDSQPAENRDARAAAVLYQAAADTGDPYAHLRLGYLAEIGDGVPQDYAVARAHYEAAVAGGLNEARLRLAICHLEGWGGPVDRAAFAREVQLAAEAGYVAAQSMLASMCVLGFAVPEDRAAAVKWLERAAAHEDLQAQYRLGRHAERLSRLMLATDLRLARTWYQLSAEQEYQTSMRAMARTFLTGAPSNRNWVLGQQWLTLATEAGDSEAPYILALHEALHPDAPGRDLDRARRWLQLASERGNMRATEVLQLEIGGRPLPEAMRYVLNTPFEDRYMQRALAKAGDAATRPPVVYRIVQPIYPQSLRLNQTTGQVLVEFVVDTTGRVVNPKVVKSAHPLFSDRAIEAVSQWRFHPGRRENRLVHTRLQVPVWFELNVEDMAGVDGLLRAARNRAQTLGGPIAADAKDLRLAKPKRPLPRPSLPSGVELSADYRVMLLLVLDPEGRPLRGYVLHANPEALGEPSLKTALAHDFEPRFENGEPVTSNVVLIASSKLPRNSAHEGESQR